MDRTGGDFSGGGDDGDGGDGTGVAIYSTKDLIAEIAKKIEWLQRNNGHTLHPDWIANAVVTDHPDIRGEDSDFYVCCARSDVRNEVRRQLGKFKVKADKESDAQLVMEGFERLQKYYLVTMDEEQVAVRIELMTDEQLEEKEREYMAMGDGCYKHADEIRRYRERRQVA